MLLPLQGMGTLIRDKRIHHVVVETIDPTILYHFINAGYVCRVFTDVEQVHHYRFPLNDFPWFCFLTYTPLHGFHLLTSFVCFAHLPPSSFIYQCTWKNDGKLGCHCYMFSIESVHTVYDAMVSMSIYGFLDIHCSADRSEYEAAQCQTPQIIT